VTIANRIIGHGDENPEQLLTVPKILRESVKKRAKPHVGAQEA
jgi:hypothetical protein